MTVADMELFVDRLQINVSRIYNCLVKIAIQTATNSDDQNVNQALAEKIQSSIQVFHFGKIKWQLPYVNETANAVSAQRAVTDTTNDLLTQNAAMLKQMLLKLLRKMSVAFVDSETLKTTQSDIVETIEQTLQINKMVVKT